jgi:VWFA-related protein
MKRLVCFLLGQILVFSAFSQQAPPPEPAGQESTIKVDVDLVNVLFSVHNRQNGLVGNLGKDDFTLYEDGKQQDIRYFTRETDLPLTIGLLVDVSLSQQNLIEIERRAAYQFFSKVLRPKDLAFLISFGADAELLQDYTNSPKLLQRGLEGLKVNAQVGGLHPGPVPTATTPKGTILYDTVYLAASDQLKGQVGRKAIVVITDGVDQGSHYPIQQAIKAGQLADAIVYAIYYVDPGAYGYGMFGGYGDGPLKRMAEETGGRVLKVDRHHTLDDIFREIQDEMRSQYSLAYAPSNGTKDGSFRRIEIKPREKELHVQARKGYYATAHTVD